MINLKLSICVQSRNDFERNKYAGILEQEVAKNEAKITIALTNQGVGV